MKNKTFWRVMLLSLGSLSFLSIGEAKMARPKITGVSHVAVYADDQAASKKFYGDLLGLPEFASRKYVYHVGEQFIEVYPAPSKDQANRLAHVAFATDDAEGMRRFLAENGIKVPEKVDCNPQGTCWFELKDPEGHPIEFVQAGKRDQAPATAKPVSTRILHAGFIVRDRAAQDKFYKDLLGFRLYWQGGMKDGVTDWVDMQVPEGTDWIEYMLNIDENPSKQLAGVMNHFALGSHDVKGGCEALKTRGFKEVEGQKVQMGRDGKWQLNLYDPDLTRVELMSFRPAEKPCCSEYLQKHPE